MAQSDSFTTSGAGDYAINYSKLTFSWSATQNIAQNKSTVSWTLTVSTGGGTYFSRYLKINGGIKYAVGVPYQNSSPQEYFGSGTELASGSFDVFHNNDGTGSFSVDIGACIQYSYWSMNPSYRDWGYPDYGNWNSKGSKTFTLNTIPRHPATITNATVTNTKYATYVVGGYSTSTINVATTLGDAPSISKYVVMYGNNKVYEGNSQPSFTVPSVSSGDSISIVYKIYVIDSYDLVSNTFECSPFTANKYVTGKATSSPITQRYNEDTSELDEDGTSAQCRLTFKSSTIGGHSISTTVTVTVNNKSGSETTTSSSATLSKVVGNRTLLGGQSYSVIYKLTDALKSNVIIATDIISISFHTMNISADGSGIGVGQLANAGYFDVNNMKPRFGAGLQEFNTASNGQMYIRDIKNNNVSDSNTGSLWVGFDSGHQNHGLYSNGYAPSSSTWTTNGKWMIYRNSAGEIIVNGKANSATTADSATTVTGSAVASTATLTRDDSIDSNKNGNMVNFWNYNIEKFGKVIFFELILRGDGAWHNAGLNMFSGRLSTDKPLHTAVGSGYWGDCVVTGNLYTDGTMVVRVSGYSSGFTFNTDQSLYMSWTYLTGD